jgi:hypothetical protein
MAVESKSLFHPEVLRQQVRSFNLPQQMGVWRPKLQHWAGLIASGRANDFKETALLPDFLTDIFCGLLGYTGPAESPDTFTFSRERHVEVDGKVADAVLGRFQKGKEQFVAVLEGKGALDPLDHPFAGRRMSAVDQAYRYAINLPCDWIIVTSMRETRLYHKGSPQNAYECFETTRLAGEPALLKRFVFLFGAERVVPVLRSPSSVAGPILHSRTAEGGQHCGGWTRAPRLPPIRTAPRLRIRRARTHQPVLRPLRRHPPKSPHPPLPRERRHRPAGNPRLRSEAAGPGSVLRLL